MAEQDGGHMAGLCKQVAFPYLVEDGLLRFSEAQGNVCKALESSGMESSDNLLLSARRDFDLDGAAGIAETGSPSSRVCLGVKIADKNIRSKRGHARQLTYHLPQVMDVSERKGTDDKVENVRSEWKREAIGLCQPSRDRRLPPCDLKHGRRQINTDPHTASTGRELFKPPARPAREIKNVFAIQVGNEGGELALFEMEQRIGSTIIGWSPTLITFFGRDTRSRHRNTVNAIR
jgi:hypothetical protein